MKVAVFLPSAGLATRMQPFSTHWPKSALPVLGIPSLEISCAKINRDLPTVEAIHVNTHIHPEQMRRLIGGLSVHSTGMIPILESYEPTLLGSLGGLIPLKKFDYDHILVMNPDIVHNMDLKHFFDFHLCHHAGLTIAVGRKKSLLEADDSAQRPGTVALGEDGLSVQALTEPKSNQFSGVGCYVYSREFLDVLPSQPTPCEFRPLANSFIRQGGSVVAYQTGESFFDFGDSPRDWFNLHTDVLSFTSSRRSLFGDLFGPGAETFQSVFGPMQISRLDKNNGEDFLLLCSHEPAVTKDYESIVFSGKNVVFAGSGVQLGRLTVANSFVIRTGQMSETLRPQSRHMVNRNAFKLEGEFCNTIDVDTVSCGL